MRHALGFALFCFGALAVPPGSPSSADPDLPAGLDLSRFAPTREDLPDGWSLSSQDRGTGSANTTTPHGCLFDGLFPGAPERTATGPDESVLTVQVFRPTGGAAQGLRTTRDWAGRCASFTMLGGGGYTGRVYVNVEPTEPPAAPVTDATAQIVTAQGPFTPTESHVAGVVRGVLVIVSQSHRPRAGSESSPADEVYRTTVEKINAWSG